MATALACDTKEECFERFGRRHSDPCFGRRVELDSSTQLEDSESDSPTQVPEVDSESDVDQGHSDDEDGGRFCHTKTDESITFPSMSSPIYVVPMAPLCPASPLSSAGFNNLTTNSSLPYMVPFAPPMMMDQLMLGRTQPILPSNTASATLASLGSESRYSNTSLMSTTPSTTAPDCAYPTWTDVEVRTSLLLRNLPNGFTRDKVMGVLRTLGLATKVDFLYNPWNLKVKQNCGYAFVNFTTPAAAVEGLKTLHGFSWDAQGENVCEVSWCSDHQGLDSHVERYRNSRIMHDSVDDKYKPALFKNGFRIPFPLPSAALQKPRLRKF